MIRFVKIICFLYLMSALLLACVERSQEPVVVYEKKAAAKDSQPDQRQRDDQQVHGDGDQNGNTQINNGDQHGQTTDPITQTENGKIKVNGLTLTIPGGWAIKQEAVNASTVIVGCGSAQEYFTFYSKQGSVDMNSVFVNGSQIITQPTQITLGSYQWNYLETSKSAASSSGDSSGSGSYSGQTVYVAAFMMQKDGTTYYGYSRSAAKETARANVESFLKLIE